MNISLTPKLESLVQQKIASGLHNSASEVIREALRLLEEKDRLQQVKLEKLRKAIDIGIQQADRGELVEANVGALQAELKKRLEK